MTSSNNSLWFPLGPLAAAAAGEPDGPAEKKSRLARLTSAGQDAVGRLRAGAQAPSESTLLAGFAAANHLTFHREREAAEPARSLVLTGSHHEVMTTSSGPVIEFGNHGQDRWYQPDRRPSRHGYIAMRHGLQLPHLFVRSSASSPRTTGRFVAGAIDAALVVDLFTGSWEDDGDGKRPTPLAQFLTQSSYLKNFPNRASRVPGKRTTAPFRVHFAKADRDRVTACATGVAAPLLHELGPSFDLELRDEWIFAYACDGDIVTTDPARWAWVLAAASRMVEFTHHLLSTQGPNPPAWNLTDISFYTPHRVDYAAPPLE